MSTNINGISAYQQITQAWKKSDTKEEKVTGKKTSSTAKTDSTKSTATTATTDASNVKVKSWAPISTTSSLVPQVKEGYGYTIGDVELSDEAKSYYDKLKAKFGNAEFILVSEDMKDPVKQNMAAYGNANKMVVLIDEEKLERMATDEDFRNKYEGIIAMAQSQMASAKNSLTSSGASVKNFGMSVSDDGTTSFFATLEKSSDAQAKRLEQKAEAKKEQKVKDKKNAEKKAQQEKLEETREKRRAEKKEQAERVKDKDSDDIDTSKTRHEDHKEYIEFEADSLDELIGKVQQYAYNSSLRSVRTAEEQAVGQNFDFKG